MSEVASRSGTTKIIGIVVILIIIGSVGAYFIISNPGQQTPEEHGITLTIITRHDTAIWKEFEPAFLATTYAKEHNITDIRWLSPVGGLWDETIEQGGVDVAWGGGPTLFDQLIDLNLLGPINDTETLAVINNISDSLAGAPMKRYDDHGNLLWVAAAISSFGFTVNHDFLDEYSLPKPTNWTDLAKPIYGKNLPSTPSIAMGNSPDTTSNTRIYEIIIQGLGWDKGWETLTRMAGNGRIYSGSVETQSAAETAEVGISMSIDFYGYSSQLRNPACEYVLPENQTIINGDPIAVVYNAPHYELAQGFIRWVLSPEGQQHWLVPTINRMPVTAAAFHTPIGQNRTDLYAIYNKTINNIGIEFNDTRALSWEVAMQQYFEAVLNHAHDYLTQAWAKLVSDYLDGKISETEFENYAHQLGKPITFTFEGHTYTFTEEYAASINQQIYTDSVFRDQIKSVWTNAAIAQYNAVYEALP